MIMLEKNKQSLSQMISAKAIKEIDSWIAKYPVEEKQSAVMAALMIVQGEHQFLTEALMDAVALYLEMPPIAVYEVASFYTMYEHKPCGRHLINVCTNISCQLRDANSVVCGLEQKLGIQTGETTEDGRFSLRTVECLGACVGAPVVQIDKDYHEHVNIDTIDEILEQYK